MSIVMWNKDSAVRSTLEKGEVVEKAISCHVVATNVVVTFTDSAIRLHEATCRSGRIPPPLRQRRPPKQKARTKLHLIPAPPHTAASLPIVVMCCHQERCSKSQPSHERESSVKEKDI